MGNCTGRGSKKDKSETYQPTKEKGKDAEGEVDGAEKSKPDDVKVEDSKENAEPKAENKESSSEEKKDTVEEEKKDVPDETKVAIVDEKSVDIKVDTDDPKESKSKEKDEKDKELKEESKVELKPANEEVTNEKDVSSSKSETKEEIVVEESVLQLQAAKTTEKIPTKENFLMQFQGEHKDNSGYIAGREIESFLIDLLQEKGEKTTPKNLDFYYKVMMETFDHNKDGRLEISEMAELMPKESNILQKYGIREKLTKEQFDEVFAHYDKDGSGSLQGYELLALLKDMFEKNNQKINPKDLDEYAAIIREIYDVEKDGALTKDEVRLVLSKGKK